MKQFTVNGYQRKEFLPVIVKSIIDSHDESLLDFKFEMNPLDKVT